MGGFDFTWNAIQSGQIREMDERVEELEKKVEILKEWIDYLNGELTKCQQAQTVGNTDTTTKT